MGFFDTFYWSRRFRRHQTSKTEGRMTAVPQFTVPEIFVDDQELVSPSDEHQDPFAQHDAFAHQRQPSFEVSDDAGILRPRAGSNGGTITPPGSSDGGGGRSRASSIQITPNASPTRGGGERGRTNTLSTPHRPSLHGANSSDFSTQGDWGLSPSNAATNRPVSPLQLGPGGSGSASSDPGGRSRAGSAVSAQDVLDVLDNSAWGESIRRSFTVRRSGSGAEGGGGGGGAG